MMNQVCLLGRLTHDPELRRTQNGTAVASLSIAVDRDYTDKESGERDVDFIDLVAWRATAEFVSNYFTRGQLIGVTGRIQVRTWQDKEGGKRRSLEVLVDKAYFAGANKLQAAGDAPEEEALPDAGDVQEE